MLLTSDVSRAVTPEKSMSPDRHRSRSPKRQGAANSNSPKQSLATGSEPRSMEDILNARRAAAAAGGKTGPEALRPEDLALESALGGGSKTKGGKGSSVLGSKAKSSMHGSKSRLSQRGSKDSVSFSRMSSKTLRRSQQVRYVKAPRPLRPWDKVEERVPSKRSSHNHHSRWHHFLAKLAIVEESESEYSDDDDLRGHKIPPNPRKQIFSWIVLPAITLTAGVILLIVFFASLGDLLPRKESTCSTVGFKRGIPCNKCQFEVAVAGFEVLGTYHLKLDSDGLPEDAFVWEKCPQHTTNCCDFRTEYNEARGTSAFCDVKPEWPCTYVTSSASSSTPQSIEAGSLVLTYNLILAFGLLSLFLFFPLSVYYRNIRRKEYDDHVETAKEESRLRLERYEQQLEDFRLAEDAERAAVFAKRGAVTMQMAKKASESSGSGSFGGGGGTGSGASSN